MSGFAFLAALALCVVPAFVDGSCACLNLKKVYDLNANGVQDSGEPEISNWIFKVRNLMTNKFYFYNTTTTLLLPFGVYEVCDQAPTSFNWYSTSANGACQTFSLWDSDCVDFTGTCMCTGSGNAQVSGVWWKGALNTIDSADLAALSALPLVNLALGPFSPASAVDLKNTYNGAAPSMPPGYYLSAQLVLATLNLRHGFTSASQLIKSPMAAAIMHIQPKIFVTIGDLVSIAIAQLIVSPSTELAMLATIAAELHNVNTNQGFVQPSSCPFTINVDFTGATDLRNDCVASTGTTGTTGCQQGCLQVSKTYDLNANGQTDAGEPEVTGWKFKVTSFQTKNFAYYTTPATLYLPFGRYEVCDVLPQQFNWWLTGRPLCQNYTLGGTECVQTTATCLCTGGSTAQAGGYWTKNPGLVTITPADLAALSASNLVKADLSPFTGFTAAQFVTWHNAATSANPPYWLSDVLALSLLNTRHGVDPATLIKAPTVAPLLGVTEHFFVPLSAIQNKAKQLLSLPAADQATQLVVAQVLKDTNANQNFAQSSPCLATFPAVVSGPLGGLQPPCGGSNPSLLVASGDNADVVTEPSVSGSGGLSTYVGIGVGAAVVAVAAAVATFFAVRKIRSGRSVEPSRATANLPATQI
eukprot:TRINITY_DN283_c0_g2_i1.p1 TRINITY_DN283_c0_g2~~TRINITY_DN283_c0_g2_i1.p1  ORF type:complete len:641 (-),score=204.28 TRINITY_DN283_c0_g2_i1:298-2220(-)